MEDEIMENIYFPMRKITLISYFFNLLAKTNKMGFLTDSLLLWATWLGICRAEYNAPPSKNLSILHKGWTWVSFVVLLSRVWFFSTPWAEAHQTSLSFTISRSLLELMSIESVMSSNYRILFCPLLFLPSLFHSIRVFSNELALHIRWPNYSSFSISLSNEYSGLISFRIDWFDLLAVQFRWDQSLSRVRLFATPWIAARQASLSITNSRSSLRLSPSSQWCHPAISCSVVPSPPAPNPSQHQSLFQRVTSSHQVA